MVEQGSDKLFSLHLTHPGYQSEPAELDVDKDDVVHHLTDRFG